MQVSADGGTPEPLTTPDVGAGEATHMYPRFLPDGNRVLFTIETRDGGSYLALLSLDTLTWRQLDLIADAGQAQYVSSEHLVFAQAGGLVAAPFDLDRGEVTGTPVPLFDGVYSRRLAQLAVSHFAISDTGTLAYVPGNPVESALVLVDRQGQDLGDLMADRGTYRSPRLSPDGSRAAFEFSEAGPRNIQVYDIERGTRSTPTNVGANIRPVWTADSEHVAFTSIREGSDSYSLYLAPADGSSEAVLLLARSGTQVPGSWFPDDELLAFYEVSPTGGRDIYTLNMEGERAVTEFLVTPANERAPAVSPDGEWLAFVSDSSGRDEVYIQQYPAGQRVTISQDGSTEPVWSADGRELFFRQADVMLAVSIVPEVGIPETTVLRTV